MEWSLVFADLEPRVRQEVLAMNDTIAILKQALEATARERDEARDLARDLREIVQAYAPRPVAGRRWLVVSRAHSTSWLAEEPVLLKEKLVAEGREE